ncbi:MAG: replicative DNA helicase [Candidatus Coatesbacteria bacterium]|nr:replicative DNA helicase [Candidatus Coatesbacteria bacterium]
MAEQTRKQLEPNSLDAEKAILGAMLLDREAISKVLEKLTQKSFYFSAHKEIFEVASELHDKGIEVDIITVGQALQDKNILDKTGGLEYLTEISNMPVTSSNLRDYIQIAEEKELYRNLIHDSSEVMKKALNQEVPVEELLEEAEKNIFGLAERRFRTGFVPIEKLIGPTLEDIERHTFSEHKLSGIPTGFNGLDNLLGGLQNANLIVIGARPGGGKTAFALNIALNASLINHPVGVFSLEMSSQQLLKRLLSAHSRVSIFDLQRGEVHHEKLEIVHGAVNELVKTPVFIDDTFDLTLLEMKSKARILKAEKNVKLLIVDYLQLLTPSNPKGDKARYQEIGEMTRALKGLSKELNIPIVALSQLSRETEKLERPPKLSDLRESGSIEQDADVVIFLHMESTRKKKTEGSEEEEEIEEVMDNYLVPIQIIVAKQRNGPTGTIKLIFNKQCSRFDQILQGSEDEPAF